MLLTGYTPIVVERIEPEIVKHRHDLIEPEVDGIFIVNPNRMPTVVSHSQEERYTPRSEIISSPSSRELKYDSYNMTNNFTPPSANNYVIANIGTEMGIASARGAWCDHVFVHVQAEDMHKGRAETTSYLTGTRGDYLERVDSANPVVLKV